MRLTCFKYNIHLKKCRDSKEIQEYKFYIPMLRWVSLMISLQVWLSASFIKLLLNIIIFGFVQCKYIWIFIVTFPDNRSFGMRLPTRASRLLHKCRENDTTVNVGQSGFDLTDDFIRFRRGSGLTEDSCFQPDVISVLRCRWKLLKLNAFATQQQTFAEAKWI